MEFEVARHAEAWSAASAWSRRRAAGTRTTGRTISQRSKEEANDYRYFPEPDLPPLRPSDEWVAQIRAAMPELPAARRARYEQVLGLSAYDAGVLTAGPGAGRLLRRGRGGRDRAEDGRQLGDRRVQPPAEPARRRGAARLGRGTRAGRAGRADRRSGGWQACRRANAKTVLADVFESGESPQGRDRARRGWQQVRDAGSIGRESRGGAGRVPGAGGASTAAASSSSTASWWGRS